MKIVTDIKKLSQECLPVDSVVEALQVIDTLTVASREVGGIGLAANQIGIDKKVFIIYVPEEDVDEDGVIHKRTVEMHFANAEIVKLEEPIIIGGEGCLSFPDQHFETIRYNKVTIKDLLEPAGRTLTGLRAVVAQHENDHVQGITMHKRKKNAQGVNAPCPCNSGLKFKKCCMGKLKKATF